MSWLTKIIEFLLSLFKSVTPVESGITENIESGITENNNEQNTEKEKKKMSKYFTLEELLTSSTARQKSIENLPSWEIVERLNTVACFLDNLREAWGSGIVINSGFRNKKLNEAVGGVTNSCHLLGWAVDIHPANSKMKEFKEFVVEWLKDQVFDEAIIEKNGKGEEWIHIQLYSPKGFQRKKIFNLEVK